MQQKDSLLFKTEDGSDPTKNGRTYSVILDPERACRHQTWLTGGDQLSFRLPVFLMGRVREGLRSVMLHALPTGASEDASVLSVQLIGGGKTWLNEGVLLSSLAENQQQSWELAERPPKTIHEWDMVLGLPEGAAPVLLSLLTVSEGPPEE